MKMEIKDFCIRCGLCIDLYPELFRRNIEEDCIDPVYDDVPEELIEKAKNAVRDCAVTCITLKKES